jgi:1-acyl-sn-glycerol-3-phosphate acyltransferase
MSSAVSPNQVPVAQATPSRFIRTLYVLMTPLARVEVRGAEHLDEPGGKVVVCNHVGWVDPLWVGYAAYPRTLHQMAKKELFAIPVLGWFVRSGGGFPVDRGRPSAATIKHAIALVARGERLLIFPAGTRTNRDDVDKKRGAATIALKGGAQIVPAYYEGPDRVKLSHLLRRPGVRVTFGAPIDTTAYVADGKEGALRLTAAMEAAMKAARGAADEPAS